MLEWHPSHQQAFDIIKKVIETELFQCNPDFNKPLPFHIHIDASDHQLGAVIMQDKMKNITSIMMMHHLNFWEE
jgi:hypothetical protein